MGRQLLKQMVCAALLAASLGGAGAAGRVAVKLPVDLPPSADLSYSIKARQKGFALNGEALISWRVGGGKYTLRSDTRASMLGNILENRSEGVIDGYGLAPVSFYEKRIRKDATTTTFDRASKSINFTNGKDVYPLKGGEQDRTSIPWQLSAVARAAPEKFTPGSEWTFFVAGRRDGDLWTFKVAGKESVRTGLGQVDALHLVRLPLSNHKDQTLDIWLAPAHEWYPVRLRFTDNDDEFVDQTLEKIAKK